MALAPPHTPRTQARAALPWCLGALVLGGLLVDAMGPWLLHPGGRITAGVGGDVSASIVKFDQLARGHVVPFLPGQLDGVGWPRGLSTSPGIDGASVLSSLFLWVGSLLFGSIAAHGLEALLGYVLTAVVTFAAARRVTGSFAAGVVAGVAYAFYPQMVAVVHAATTYSHMWLFVLPLWALWELGMRPCARRGALAGIAVVPALFWTPYFALHATVVLGAGVLLLAVLAGRLAIPRRALVLAVAPVLVAGAGLVLIGVLTGFKDQPDRPLSDAYQQSAHPLMYLTPGTDTTWTHAGAGLAKVLREATLSVVPRAAGTDLYLGLTVVVLALIGLLSVGVPWLRRRGSEGDDGPALAALLGAAVVVACFICSLPPKVHGVPMPGLLIHELVPGLRAGQRFVMPLMAGLSLTAAVGMWRLLRGRSPRASAAITALVLMALFVDHRTVYADSWTPIPAPSRAIDILAHAPPGPAIHIQPAGYIAGPGPRPCFLQMTHHHPLVNVCGIGPPPPWLWDIGLKPLCQALTLFHERGLRYVIADHIEPDDPVPACMRRRYVGPSRLLADDGQVRVWALASAR